MSEERAATPSLALCAALFACVFSLLTLSAGQQPIGGDATQMCAAAQSLLDHGGLDVPGGLRSDLTRGPSGKFFTKYPLATVLACVPTIRLRALGDTLGGRDSSVAAYVLGLTPSFYGACAALGFFLLLLQLGLSQRLAACAALALIFTTPAWHYARSMYSENAQLAALSWTMFVWLRARGGTQARWLVLGGCLLGLCINLKALLAILSVAALVDRCFEARDRRSWLRFFAFTSLGAAPGLVAFFWYNTLRYGQLLAAGYTTGRDGLLGFQGPLLIGLHGLLLSSGKSIFLYAPLLLLGFSGVAAMWRECKRDLLFFGLPVVFMFMVVAKWWAWSGDIAWGPRLVVPLLPCLFVPVAWSMQRMRGARLVPVVLLALLGLYVGVLGVAVRPYNYVLAVRAATGNALGVAPSEAIRDDLFLLHFVPEFSPIAGHQWFLARALTHEKSTAEADYPWSSLHIAAWAPRPDPAPPLLNFWFARGMHYPILVANLCVALLAAACLVVLLRRAAAGATISREP